MEYVVEAFELAIHILSTSESTPDYDLDCVMAPQLSQQA